MNRLKDEKSPYLKQHADNPVDWHPWGEEAFRRAREEDKPVFLSIGYATCHWCHVMAHESFEDPEVARLMNEAFVSIKVDREERPDIDHTYMLVCQMMSGQGGWPLNVLLTPDKEPFYSATYLPKRGRGGRPGMLELVPWIDGLWEDEREKVMRSAENLTEAYRKSTRHAGETFDYEETLDTAWQAFRSSYDPEHGGFGEAPKFPSPHNLGFLLRYGWRTDSGEAADMVERTLTRMRYGGLFDQVGFGFHRYSTDRRWLVPHFEKMLYDQAGLLMAYTEGWQVTGRELFRDTARQIVTYLERCLLSDTGGFHSAEDADSPGGGEGDFYTWTADEIRELLPPGQAELVLRAWNFTEEGNWREESSGRRDGTNIPHRDRSLAELAGERGEEPETTADLLENARGALREAREERPRPGLDHKILTDWNGMTVAALARAARTFGREREEELARGAADFLLDEMRHGEGHLLHRWCEGERSVRGNADDYAFLLWGLLELHETTRETRWLEEAVDLAKVFVRECWDPAEGGFFFTGASEEVILARAKEFYDGAMPSANSVAACCLLRLARLTGESSWEEKAERTLALYKEQVSGAPTAFSQMLQALEWQVEGGREIIVRGKPGEAPVRRFLEDLNRRFLPHRAVLVAGEGDETLARLAPFLENFTRRGGEPAFYICRNYTCERPVTDPEKALELLE
ncbi:MAG: thioredoxin domain-containing protein [Balneolaceae bacterium]|nr:thioredoxin domain-containing protein [Balneolaceae bacterium]